MAVNKRTRFEVLRRDGHTCRYCGASAPEVVLTVDHVVPESLGGADTPDNLVTACRDCNAGKTSTSPDERHVTQVSEDALRWAAARARAAKRMEDAAEQRAALHGRFHKAWCRWDDDAYWLPTDWSSSLDRWLAGGVTMPLILDCLDIAVCNTRVSPSAVFKYMAGVLRNKLIELEDLTKEELEACDGEA